MSDPDDIYGQPTRPGSAPIDETHPVSRPASLVGQSIGPYKLREEIGEGGMGIVYVAERETPFRQRVALKVIKPGMDSRDVIARFSAERQALALMEHPNIAKVLDAGSTESGHPYFVMELVRGIAVTDYCDQKRLTIRERAKLFIQICQAIQHAHQKGVIHRDIKPSNVLVTEHDGQPVPKIIDFGVAKAMNQPLTENSIYTMHRQVVGTVQYMSPEQSELSGVDIDTRSDVYALGLLLYELITSTLPFDQHSFDQASFDEKRRIIREDEPARPSLRVSSLGNTATEVSQRRRTDASHLRKELSGDLDWIVMRSLEKDRSRRYESAIAMARDVERFLNDEPVLAGPPSVSYRAGKFLRRNRGAVLAASVIAVLAVGLGSWAITNQAQRRSEMAVATNRLSDAIEQASLDLGRAVSAPIGHEDDWIEARASRQRVLDLLNSATAGTTVSTRARRFIATFDRSSAERDLAKQIEDILITQATHTDLAKWSEMEEQLRDVFRQRGIDFDQLTPTEVSDRIRAHESAVRLSDALELWIATRAQMSGMGGPKATRATMEPWANALYRADPDPLRHGIRKVIYERKGATRVELEALIGDLDLSLVHVRTLSWLGIAFLIAGEPQRSEEIHKLALQLHPDDLMMNHDFAASLGAQQDWNKAIRYYMRCTAIRPDVAGVWSSLGDAYRENGELTSAREALEYSLELSPTSASAFAGLGRTLMDLGKYDDALVALERCRKLLGDQVPQIPLEEWLTECRNKL